MNPGEFKLSIHGGLWPICKALKILTGHRDEILTFVLFEGGDGFLGGKSFDSIDELIDLLIEVKQQEAKDE